MISLDEKGTVFPIKLKLQEELLGKKIKKENFKKVLINFIETIHEINMTSDHSV